MVATFAYSAPYALYETSWPGVRVRVPPADAGAITTTDAASAIGSATASRVFTFFVNIKFLSGISLESVV